MQLDELLFRGKTAFLKTFPSWGIDIQYSKYLIKYVNMTSQKICWPIRTTNILAKK